MAKRETPEPRYELIGAAVLGILVCVFVLLKSTSLDVHDAVGDALTSTVSK